jgi:hypothetical protein
LHFSRQIDGVEGHAERLEHRPLLIGNVIGNGDEATGRPDHVASQGTVNPVPGKSKVEAEVGAPGNALLAFQTRYGRVDGDSLPGPGPGLDDRGELMAEHQAVAEDGVADCAFAKPMRV